MIRITVAIFASLLGIYGAFQLTLAIDSEDYFVIIVSLITMLSSSFAVANLLFRPAKQHQYTPQQLEKIREEQERQYEEFMSGMTSCKWPNISGFKSNNTKIAKENSNEDENGKS